MKINPELPSYEELFGEVDLKKADDARSVYSPAAYLADLIQLLDDKFEAPTFNQENRRVDIKELPLDSENTYSSIPYLNIVNEVLENVLAIKLGVNVDLYGKLKSAKYPFHLPFNFDNERIKKFINYLKVTAEQLYKLFSLQVDPDIVAREYLGLSLEDYELITEVVPEGTLSQYFNDQSFEDLKDVAQFITITGLSGQEVRELLYQDLSENAKKSESITERVKASELFINHQLNGYVKLDQTEENIVWKELDQSESTTSIPVSWYERVNRFVRLAKKIQLSLTDLDIILRSCCQNTLDAEAVRTIAVIKQIHDLYELPIDVVCSFFSDINSLGIGSDKEPKDLFNRVFNSKFATLEQEYIRVGEFIPEKYSDYARLTCSGDLLSFNNKDYRSRLQKALNISDKDLTYVVNKFRDRAKGDQSKTSLLAKDRNIGLPALSLLFRISKLTEVLDISYEDLFNLLDILEKDPSIRTYSNFNILINHHTQEQDCYHILEGESDLSSSMWLVQVLFAATDWMHTNDFTSEELKYVLTGKLKDQTELETSRDEKINVLNTLYQNFKSVILEADLFESDRFDSRSARVIYRALSGEGSQVVSNKDRRVIYDQRSVEQLVYTALNQLEIIEKEDFMHLGLEQKMRDKIFNTMIIKGYINPEGSLNEENLSQSAHEFQIETDFSAYKEEVFTLIYGLFAGAVESTDFDEEEEEEEEDIENELDDETIATLEFSVYPSDLEEIENFSQAHRNELYDNLIFNGYIDEEGNVLQPDFFALAENAADFQVNTPIATYSTDVFNLISAQVNKFNEERLILDQEIFSALSLNAMEIDDLMENLKFNEYIDSDNVLTNKRELLAQDVKGFKLALPFYPYRHKILNAIKKLITEFKSDFYTLRPESLAGIADKIVAEQIYKTIESDYLQDGMLKEDKKAFFLEQDNVEQFTVGSYFTPIDTAVIFSTLSEIIAGYQKYQLTTKPLDELDFNLEEREELMDVLETNGYGIEQGKIPYGKLEYFLNSNNALDFTLDKFEDYNKDIFFVLHAIAKEIDASVRENSENVKMLAEKQERVVLETLQDAFGIDAEVVNAVCQQVFRDGETIVEEFLIPVFALVNSQDVISAEPNNQKFNLAYRRILQFARLAAKLRLSQEETEVVFHEQDLVDKFPEKLVLPETIDRFDALLEHPDGVIYIFKDDNYWAYSSETYNLVETKDNTSETKDNKLTSLSDKFAGLTKIDAAFTDKRGTSFIIAGGNCYCNEKESKRWVQKDRVWGKVKSNFDDPEKVEAAFQDKQGKTYLFAGDQYIRYSGNDYDHVDEGYPLTIAGNWKTELSNAHLPQEFQESIDAAFQGTNDKTYLFKGSKFVCSDNLSIEMDINQTWGKVKNNFKELKKIDAAYADGGNLLVFAGNQVILYQDSLENDQVKGLEGFPKLIKSHYPNVPFEFADGVDAAFKGEDGKIHLFKDGMVVSFESNQASMTVAQVKEQWGVVRNTILESGRVDAAFVSLEGKTYLFSGNQYFQYSGSDYSQVDEGFPRTIAGDWGGLNTVYAAFVLDGKTYLFGKTGAESDHVVYVRYSQNDYTKPDEGYPQEPNDNWWNLPFNLVQEGADFNQIDAVFTSNDHKTYLFSGNQFIYFDHQQRWWSEPQLLSTQWDSIPFASVDAAFMGRDGKTYLFSGTEYVKYSSPNYSKIDDRYPNITNRYWGNVVNNIAKTGNVDAAIVVESREMIDDVEQTTVHTYLFSGNQYFRYKGNHYDAVEEGYPKYIVPSLKDEPRFKNLKISYENGIDAAFADRRTIYLFKQTEGYVVSESLSKKYDDLGFTQVDCAFIDQGALFVAENATWHRYSSLEGKVIQKTAVEPSRLREVPDKFKTGLDAVLQGIDRNTYLFKGQDCFNVLLNKEYPLAEEWGRERNTIYINNTVDAAFVGRDGKTYLFSGDQYVTYAGDTYIKAEIEDTPKPIKEKWGGLTSVGLAFVKDDKTYLFEKADDEGKFRYLCYSTDDYTQPDPGFPQTAEPDFLQIPATYTEEGFNQIDAVLFEADNMFVLSENRYIQFNFTENQWAYPRPLDRIWREIPLNHDSFARVKTAFTGRDGVTYFFADNYYVKYEDNSFTAPALIQEDWGIVHNNFVNNSPDNNSPGNKIDAACVWQNQITYLVSGDQYVRYSGKDYRYVDEGYPKPIANHLRREAGFENLPEDFEEILGNRIANGENRIIDAIIANHRTLYIFMGSHCYVVSQTLDAVYDIDIIGNIKNTILQKNQVDAGFVNERGQTFLFSGDQGVRYSDDRYDTVDDGYPQPIATVLTTELGISSMPEKFQYGIDAALRGRDGNLYLFKNEDYLSSAESEPKSIKETWGKVKNNFISHPGAIDAAFVAPDHHLYVFKGDQYIRYHDAEQEFVDPGYPHAIKDNWGNLPINFEESIDGGFVFEGKTYLLKGDDYVRYSDSRYQYIDSIYPQTFKYRWGDWADYLLSDIKTITRFKQLQDGYSNGDYSLTDFLHPEKGLVKDPYKMLAEMFGWDSDDVKWLKRNNGFLGTDNRFEVRFNLEMVIKFVDVFSVTEKMGTSPAKLHTEVWQKMYPPSDLGSAADTLYKLLGLLNS